MSVGTPDWPSSLHISARAGDWLIFPANSPEVHRSVRRLSYVVPGKMCLVPLSWPVNGSICCRAGCVGRIRVTFPSTAGKAGPTRLPNVRHGPALPCTWCAGQRHGCRYKLVGSSLFISFPNMKGICRDPCDWRPAWLSSTSANENRSRKLSAGSANWLSGAVSRRKCDAGNILRSPAKLGAALACEPSAAPAEAAACP